MSLGAERFLTEEITWELGSTEPARKAGTRFHLLYHGTTADVNDRFTYNGKTWQVFNVIYRTPNYFYYVDAMELIQ